MLLAVPQPLPSKQKFCEEPSEDEWRFGKRVFLKPDCHALRLSKLSEACLNFIVANGTCPNF